MTGVNFENYSERIDNITCNLIPTRFININDTQIAKIPYIFNFSNFTNMYYMFDSCGTITFIPNFDTSNVTNMANICKGAVNLINVPEYNTSNVTDLRQAFVQCNLLSNDSIQNIVNMCINSNITTATYKNLSNINSNSPLYQTRFNSSYYSNRLSDLLTAGWSY